MMTQMSLIPAHSDVLCTLAENANTSLSFLVTPVELITVTVAVANSVSKS